MNRKLSGSPRLIKWVVLCFIIALIAFWIGIAHAGSCVQKVIAECEAMRAIFPSLPLFVAVRKSVATGDSHCEPLLKMDGDPVYFQFRGGNYEFISSKAILAQVFDGPVRIYDYDTFKRAAAKFPGLNPIELAVFAAVGGERQ